MSKTVDVPMFMEATEVAVAELVGVSDTSAEREAAAEAEGDTVAVAVADEVADAVAGAETQAIAGRNQT